jgi:nucleoid-associated protein YgaU
MIMDTYLKKLWLVLLVVLLVAACNSNSSPEEQLLPERLQPAQVESPDESPRGEATPEPGLPPTWTPVPSTGEGHVFDLRNQQGVQITGTRTIYIVQRGDTLGEIATRFGVTLSDLARINNIENWDIIEVGDELIIP